MAKYISFETLKDDEFIRGVEQILTMPVPNREAYDSIDAIEDELNTVRSKKLKVMRLQNRDYNFLKSQIDHALANRWLTPPKEWRKFIQVFDDAKSERPESYPLPEKGAE